LATTRIILLCVVYRRTIFFRSLIRPPYHYLFLAYIPVSVGLGAYLRRLAIMNSDDRVWAWTKYSITFFSVVLVIGAISGPFVMWHRWPFLALPVTVLGATLVGLAMALFFIARRRVYAAIVAGFTVFPLVVNLVLQSLIFPSLNPLQFRPLAERVGAVLAAASQGRLAIYQHKNTYDFNYYSRTKKFEILGAGASLRTVFDRPGQQFLLLRSKDLKSLQKQTKDPYIVLAENMGPGQWVLLSLCNGECNRPTIPADLIRQTPLLLEASTDGQRDHQSVPTRR
jgi:hypothetical protein